VPLRVTYYSYIVAVTTDYKVYTAAVQGSPLAQRFQNPADLPLIPRHGGGIDELFVFKSGGDLLLAC
jgi:hypothetical protein